MTDLIKAMAEVNDLNRTHGVTQRGGKKYTEVFRVFFAKNISSRLQNYSDQNIKVTGSKRISDNYVLVNSKMVSKKNNQEIKKVEDYESIEDQVSKIIFLATQ